MVFLRPRWTHEVNYSGGAYSVEVCCARCHMPLLAPAWVISVMEKCPACGHRGVQELPVELL